MDCHVDNTRQERFLDLFGELAFTACLDQRSGLKVVSRGSDDLDAGCHAAPVQMLRNKLGLPQSKLRAAGADRQGMRPKRARCHSKSGVAQSEHAANRGYKLALANVVTRLL